jgi:hypothetical protein
MGVASPMDRQASGPAAEPHPAFAETLFLRLRAEAGRTGSRRARWVVAAVAAVLLVAALVGGVVLGSGLLSGLPSGAGSSPTPTRTPAASPEASATTAASPSATATASPGEATPSPTAGTGIAAGDLVETTVEALTVRADPGTDADGLGTLALGSVSYVAGGPTQADGYTWYALSGLGLPPATGCGPDSGDTDPYDCPIWFGWVAGAAADGSPWLVVSTAECSEPAGELQELTLARAPLELLRCYGHPPGTPGEPQPGRDLSVRAWLPTQPGQPAEPCEAPEAIAWLACPQIVLGWDQGYPDAIRAANRPADADGVSLPASAQWVRVTAHFDDPAAVECGGGADDATDELRAILTCRATLVITAVEPAPAP